MNNGNNNIIDNNYDYNNKIFIKNELDNINNLENNIKNTKNEYYIQLLLQYFKIKGINKNEILPILIKENNYDFNSLIRLYPDFLDYISLCDKLSEYYLSYLDNETKINVDSPNTYEINKGEFDSAATENMTVISKYANTMGLTPSMLHRTKDKVYKISEDGSIDVIPEGSTIVIHNTYNIKDILYTLLTLSGLDINVIIGAWGFKYHIKEHLKKLKIALEIAKVLGCENINITEQTEKDNIVCINFNINTKKINNNIEFDSLITTREKNLLTNFYKNINYEEEKITTNNKILKR